MPDGPFLAFADDTIPLNCNAVPLAECKEQPFLKNGKVISVLGAPVKGCASLWLRCQKEAEKWVTDARTGKIISDSDPVRINRRINAAYAYL